MLRLSPVSSRLIRLQLTLLSIPVDLNAQSANLQPNHAGTLVLICGTYWSSFTFSYAASPWLLQRPRWAEKTGYSMRRGEGSAICWTQSLGKQHLKADADQPCNICDGIYVHISPPLNWCFPNVILALSLPGGWGEFISLNVCVCVQTSGVVFCRCRCQPVEESTVKKQQKKTPLTLLVPAPGSRGYWFLVGP